MTDLTPAPFVSPMALVAEATRAGNLELVRELLALKREHEQDEARKAFNSALAAACGELPDIQKGKLVDFVSPRGGRVRYRHATLASILNQVRPVLAKHALFVSFDLDENDKALTVGCRLRHDAGHEQVTRLSGPRDESGTKNVLQSKGSAVTYLERYTLCAALGIAASDDDDGQASGQPVGARQAAPPAATTPIGTRDVAGIKALCAELSDPRALPKILAFAQAEELEDITVDQLPMILEWLRKKKEAEVSAAEVEQALEDELVEEFGPVTGGEGSSEQA